MISRLADSNLSSLRKAALYLGVVSSVLLGTAAVVSAAGDLDDSRRELQEIQKRIGQTARTLEEKRQAEKMASSDLQRVEKTLGRISERSAALGRELYELDLKIRSAQGEIGSTGARLDGLKGQVNRRLIALYKGGDDHLAKTLFAPSSAIVIFEDLKYWQHIVRNDRLLVRDYHFRLDSQKQGLQQLGELRVKQESVKGELQREQEEMGRALKVKQQLLAKVRKDKDYLANELSELKERAARVDSLVRRLESSRQRDTSPGGTGFAAQKGRLEWPVNGRVRIPYGESRHPELGTPYQSHGIELEVGDGRSISAVWSGRVAYASYFKGYGNLVIIDHGEGYYTLYAFAAELKCKAGERVESGRSVAVTDGKEGRFYFEVRKGGTPQNPIDWLR